MSKHILFLLLLATILQSLKSHAQMAGDLDNTFEFDGKVTANIGSYGTWAYAMAIQSDGKIVVAGDYRVSADYGYVLMRYNTDGSLDNTFDGDGKISGGIQSPLSLDHHIYSILIQNDGRIVATGVRRANGNNEFYLTRYNTNGSIDSTFDGDGKLTVGFPYGPFNYAYSSVLQNDGKIVIAGSTRYIMGTKHTEFALVRVNSNGSLDSTFDTDGKLSTAFDSIDVVRSVAIQNDGKIVAAGYSHNGSNNDFALTRYNTDGTLDTTFDADGKLTTSFGNAAAAYSMVIQNDGKIVLAGISNNGPNKDFALARYNTDGSLDNTFDTDGKLTSDFGISDDGAYAIALQSDGKIIASGYSNTGINSDFALARYNTDGSLDNTFNLDGKLITDFGSKGDTAHALAIQSDGKIVLAGTTVSSFALARYLDTTFVVEVDEDMAESSFTAYPNPSNGRFTIQSSKRILKIQITNLMGEQVYLRNDGSYQIQISDRPQGIYFLRVVNEAGTVVQKIVKE